MRKIYFKISVVVMMILVVQMSYLVHGSHLNDLLFNNYLKAFSGTDASASNITMLQEGGGVQTFNPEFNPNVYEYSATVPLGVTYVMLTPFLNDPNASVTVNGDLALNGNLSGTVNVELGNNPIQVVITAEDGVTTKTYTFNVKRLDASEVAAASISLMQEGGGSQFFTPSFDPTIFEYEALVPHHINYILSTTRLLDPSSTIMVNGNQAYDGIVGGALNLQIGLNVYTVSITDSNGNTVNYVFNITRAGNSDARALGITLMQEGGGDQVFSPGFDPDVYSYTADVPANITYLLVRTSLSDPSSVIRVNGVLVANNELSGTYNLVPGINTITVQVTAGDGTIREYVFTVIRAILDGDGDGVADDIDECPNTPAGVVVDSKGCPVDSDGDGVADYLDECPNTPAGVVVDSKGCPVDSDGDGVADYLDECPNTPTGVVVDSKGCPVDSDGDGVADYLDECPNTPAGVVVDSKGCPVDSDGDGVADYLDECPNTPAGVVVDSKGCPVDSDGDGVADYLDECPNTPAGVVVDSKGCPVDSDGDGVADYLDECPNTPAGVVVDSKGCPVDSDGDGVADYLDECPNTPAGVVVDSKGCPDLSIDTDGDGVPDYIEFLDGTDPNDPLSYKDTDGDEVPDYVEGLNGTNPNDPGDYKDTDGDGVPDYIEARDGTNINDPLAYKDTDGDGVPDYVQVRSIISTVALSEINVAWKTKYESIVLPSTVVGLTGRGELITLDVKWVSTNYNELRRGRYISNAELVLPRGIFNAYKVSPQQIINVLPKAAPQDLVLSNNQFDAKAGNNYIFVGRFDVLDPTDNVHLIELVSGANDNQYFEIKDGFLFWSTTDPAAGKKDFTILVKVTDRDGNVIQKSFTITRKRPTLDEIVIFNTFTPNGDRVNDTWGVPDLRFYLFVEIQVFERSGLRVYNSNKPDERWDGTFQGKELPVGTYYYIIKEGESGSVRKGTINLLRN